MRSALADVEAKGQVTVRVASLQEFLANVKTPSTQPQPKARNVPLELLLESFKADRAAGLAHYNAEHSSSLELFKSVLEATKGAVQSLFIVNGGGAVALLAFIGHLARLRGGAAFITYFADAMLCFVTGAGFAVLLAIAFCLGQKAFTKNGRAQEKQCSSCVLPSASRLSFFGCCMGYEAFVGLKSYPDENIQ